jgi:Methyladenine glycosylase
MRARSHRCSSGSKLVSVPPKQIRPKSLADYLEVLSKIAFEAGLSGRVVEAKWDGIKKAFHGFDPDRVARMTPRAVDKLLEDERVIRSRSKIEATLFNAERMLELDEEHGGFKRYLRSHADFEATVKDLRKQFKFLGDHGAYRFLWIVGEKVPSYQEWAHSRGMDATRGEPRRRARR